MLVAHPTCRDVWGDISACFNITATHEEMIMTCKNHRTNLKNISKCFTYGYYKSWVREILAKPLPTIFSILTMLSSLMFKISMTYKTDSVKSALECPYTLYSVIIQS